MIAKIEKKKIDRIEIYVNSAKKSLSTIMKETGADYGINGTLYNPNWTACMNLKSNGKTIQKDPYRYWGFGWNTGADITMDNMYENYLNYICCVALVHNYAEEQVNDYDKALGYSRGRTGIGETENELILYCTKDGSSEAKYPSALRKDFMNMKARSAIMLDGGGSSQCNFQGQKITSTRVVQNLVLVYLKKESEQPVEPTGKISVQYQTKNKCYTNAIKRDMEGNMVHSTATPDVMAQRLRDLWNSAAEDKCVHFILDNTTIIQCLPMNYKSWNAGVGTSGVSANNTHISYEICEPKQMRLYYQRTLYSTTPQMSGYDVQMLQQELKNLGYHTGSVDGYFGQATKTSLAKYQKAMGLSADGSCGPATWKKLASRAGTLMKYNPNDPETKAYFDAIWKNAVWLSAYICKTYGWDEKKIICHSEGYRKGIATNHADVMHWFPLHGMDMDKFRAAVKAELNGGTVTPPTVDHRGTAQTRFELANETMVYLDGYMYKDSLYEKLATKA